MSIRDPNDSTDDWIIGGVSTSAEIDAALGLPQENIVGIAVKL